MKVRDRERKRKMLQHLNLDKKEVNIELFKLKMSFSKTFEVLQV